MAVNATNLSDALQLRRTFSASPERVFMAWADPDSLGKWFGPSSHHCRVDEFNFKQGGRYQISMLPIEPDPDCGSDGVNPSVCAGEFMRIEKPSLIVMSFSWIENATDIGDTLLTIEINPSGNGSEIILTHEQLPDEEIRLAHQTGWQGTLDGLQAFLD